MLGCFHVEVCDDRRSIADIRIQGTLEFHLEQEWIETYSGLLNNLVYFALTSVTCDLRFDKESKSALLCAIVTSEVVLLALVMKLQPVGLYSYIY